MNTPKIEGKWTSFIKDATKVNEPCALLRLKKA